MQVKTCHVMVLDVLTRPELLQAKSRGLNPSDCQALSDIADMGKALLRQREMLGQFQELTYPKLNTWVVVRVTESTPQAQPAATTPAAADSIATSAAVLPPLAENGAPASTPPIDAVAAPPGGSVQNRASSVSTTQAEAGTASQTLQGEGKPKQKAQVRHVGLVSTNTLAWPHSGSPVGHGMLVWCREATVMALVECKEQNL